MDTGQTWALIGGTLGLMTFGFTWLHMAVKGESAAIRGELRGEVSTLRADLKGDIGTLSARIGGLEQRVGLLDQRVGSLEHRFDQAFDYRLKTQPAPPESAVG